MLPGNIVRGIVLRQNDIVKRLEDGYTVEYKPVGNSMNPLIKSGQLVKIEPCYLEDVDKGDIVYCKVNGNYFLHLVKAIGQDGRLLIANNQGHNNGWTKLVYGKFVK